MTEPMPVYIAQGERAIGSDADTVITTILGSCVAVCMWDQDRGIGGMNHILLPSVPSGNIALDHVGACAMEELINDLTKAGAARSGIRAKIFGGASVVAGLSNIGACNVTFAKTYLMREGFSCDVGCVGGVQARHIRFWPATGRVTRRFVDSSVVPDARKVFVNHRGEVELF